MQDKTRQDNTRARQYHDMATQEQHNSTQDNIIQHTNKNSNRIKAIQDKTTAHDKTRQDKTSQ